MSKIKPVTSKEYLESPDTLPIDEEGGLLIVPEPGIVFKTKETLSGAKFFINVVHHPAIDKPEAKEMVEMDVDYRSNTESTRRAIADVCRQHP